MWIIAGVRLRHVKTTESSTPAGCSKAHAGQSGHSALQSRHAQDSIIQGAAAGEARRGQRKAFLAAQPERRPCSAAAGIQGLCWCPVGAGLTDAGAAECLDESLYAPRACHALALLSASISLNATFSHCCRSKSCLTLSTVLSQNPQLFDDKKIGVVEKFITEVDLLPQRYHHVRVSLRA